MFAQRLWKKAFLVVTGLVLVVALLVGAGAYAVVSQIQRPADGNKRATGLLSNIVPANKADNRINILLLGLDDGDPGNAGSPRRSDTMMVASIDPDKHTVYLLSIPRDTRVRIPGHSGYDKITHAFFYGGANLAIRTVEDNFHIPISNYVTIDWQAFIKVVDILGGVDLSVEQAMNYEDPYENLSIHLDKGYQHLNGEKAGEYVRFRHDELGDIGRVERQQKFLKALTDQMLQAGTILKLPSIMNTVSRYIQTDMNTYTLLQVANILKSSQSDSLTTEMVPGDFVTIDDLSYWVPDRRQLRQITQERFSEG